jgi:F-type H+-transporting ATPase subunit a
MDLTSLVSLIIAQGHPPPEAVKQATEAAGDLDIIGHVSNSSLDHPIIHLPTVLGINFSVTKHVFMLWLVAALVFVGVTLLVRRYVRQPRLVPAGPMGVLEVAVEFVRDGVAKPNVGSKWLNTWAPLLLTLFIFIFCANFIGIIPIFDALALLDHYVLHTGEGSVVQSLIHGSSTATGNFNVTAGLAVISFIAIIAAGTKAHGFLQHWKNLVPSGQPIWLFPLLIPMEIIGMLVRPFALTMRLAANMTGGHIAILAILSFVFVFTQMLGTWIAGVGVGLLFAVPLSVLLSVLEIIVVLVQAYVFTLLTAVFIGMAIHAHH